MTRKAAVVLVAVALAGQAALAQPDSRNSFPGRRVGGGTRGACTSRLIAHLAPATTSSAFQPLDQCGWLCCRVRPPSLTPCRSL